MRKLFILVFICFLLGCRNEIQIRNPPTCPVHGFKCELEGIESTGIGYHYLYKCPSGCDIYTGDDGKMFYFKKGKEE